MIRDVISMKISITIKTNASMPWSEFAERMIILWRALIHNYGTRYVIELQSGDVDNITGCSYKIKKDIARHIQFYINYITMKPIG